MAHWLESAVELLLTAQAPAPLSTTCCLGHAVQNWRDSQTLCDLRKLCIMYRDGVRPPRLPKEGFFQKMIMNLMSKMMTKNDENTLFIFFPLPFLGAQGASSLAVGALWAPKEEHSPEKLRSVLYDNPNTMEGKGSYCPQKSLVHRGSLRHLRVFS